jgi:hypothetical protein
MQIEEIKAMLGTEFMYQDGDGYSIKAYIKAFDPEIGFSMYSLGNKLTNGDIIPGVSEEEGACVCAYNLKEPKGRNVRLKIISAICTEIAKTGVLDVKNRPGDTGPVINQPKCQF